MKQRDQFSTTEFIQKAETVSMRAWLKIKTLLAEAGSYKLTPNENHQRDLLNDYVDLRIEHTQTWIKAEKEQDTTYLPKMDSLANAIDNTLAALSAMQGK